MKITGVMLAQSIQSSIGEKITYEVLTWSGLANTAQENYMLNVGPQSTNKFA